MNDERGDKDKSSGESMNDDRDVSEIIECAPPLCFAGDSERIDGELTEPSPRPPEGVPEWRRRTRGELLAARLAVPAAERARAAATVAATLDELISFGPATIVSVYWPFKGELNLRSWIERPGGEE